MGHHQHVLRVEASAARHATLIGAARAAGLRVGWLEIGERELEASPELLVAAELGALRAVAVGPGGSVAVKTRHGAPVLRDLLREHFGGCGLVLVRGEVSSPLLEADGDGWRVRGMAGGRRLSTGELVSRLRRPRLD